MTAPLSRRALLRYGGAGAGLLVAARLGGSRWGSLGVAAAGFTLNGFPVEEPFATYWNENGGLAQQGLPLAPAFTETNPTDGKPYKTQYFERARFESHPEYPNTPVLLGLLGREQFQAKYPDRPINPDPNSYQIPSLFQDYWNTHGGLAQQGYPISGVFTEVNPSDGKPYEVQYFERARFEHHPEITDPQYQVLLGLLGREQFLAKYPSGAPSGEVPLTGKEKVYRGNGWMFYNSDGALVQLEPTNPDALNQLPDKLPPSRTTALYMARDMKDATALANQLGLDPKYFDDAVANGEFVGKMWTVPFGTPLSKPGPLLLCYDQRIKPVLASNPEKVHQSVVGGVFGRAAANREELSNFFVNGAFNLMFNNTKISY